MVSNSSRHKNQIILDSVFIVQSSHSPLHSCWWKIYLPASRIVLLTVIVKIMIEMLLCSVKAQDYYDQNFNSQGEEKKNITYRNALKANNLVKFVNFTMVLFGPIIGPFTACLGITLIISQWRKPKEQKI